MHTHTHTHRYADHVNNEEQALHLMEGVVNSLQKVTHRNHDNLDLLAFWMANTCRLMHDIKQFSGNQVKRLTPYDFLICSSN